MKLIRFSFFIITFLTAIAYSGICSTVKGKLINEDKEPLIGAHIVIKELQKAAIAGLDGSFSITNVPVGEYTLMISYVGYQSLEKKVRIETEDQVQHFDLKMESSATSLSEVIVDGVADQGSDATAR